MTLVVGIPSKRGDVTAAVGLASGKVPDAAVGTWAFLWRVRRQFGGFAGAPARRPDLGFSAPPSIPRSLGLWGKRLILGLGQWEIGAEPTPKIS